MIIFEITCEHHIPKITCGNHMWTSHTEIRYHSTVKHMWTSHVNITYRQYTDSMWCSHVILKMFTCDLPYVISRCVGMWCSHVMLTCVFNDVGMWFSVCDVHMWFSSMITYGPYVITYGKHMWFHYTHVMFTCEHNRMWCSHVNTLSDEMNYWVWGYISVSWQLGIWPAG